MKAIGYVLYGIYVLTILWLMMSAFVQLHLLWHARKQKNKFRQRLSSLPFVSVQVPVYNEKFVIEGLLRSLASLDYPKQLFEIQVLDDSTDETVALVDAVAAELKQQGYQISVVRRTNRQGYKAGALQHGLPLCEGDLIAIFDADFRPPKNFLHLLLPYFDDESVGLAQARWGHLNREQNFLTRIQTYLLDMHFSVEQEGRFKAGYFINFCGTAGIWRRQCIVDAGGWDGTVLSEDLDLSYRAQLKGWKIIFDKEVIVPAQLPAAVEAFKIQQFRWTKGIAQIAKKTLRSLWQMHLPLAKKLHGVFHLLGSFTFVCLFVNAILTVPMLQLRHAYEEFVLLTNFTAVGVLNLAALAYIYYASTEDRPKKTLSFLLNYPVFVMVYLAMSVQNTVAVLQGFMGMNSPFVRTPKADSTGLQNAYVQRKISFITILEIVLLLYFLYGIGLSMHYDDYFLLCFFVLMATGLGILLYQTLPPLRAAEFFGLPLQRQTRLSK